ncbi:MAG: hypothetical protein DYH12_36170, partial [Sorangiineae bacterium PRO1]|nr:hypothetical protein [Sorangiineae bacterium PRO1]
AIGVRERFELEIARAALARMRGDDTLEQGHYERALRLAADADDALLLGIVYGALGKFHEPRDLDRAFAYYQDSAECLRRSGVGDDSGVAAEVIEEYVATPRRRLAACGREFTNPVCVHCLDPDGWDADRPR